MREIKFRGKCLTKDGWAYGMPLASRFGCSYMITKQGQLRADFIYSRHTIMDIEEAIAVDTETVGQFTGLKDKNGVEIYEGDIIEFVTFFTKDIVVEQVWIDEDACLHPFLDPFYIGDEQGAGLVYETIKVIGNIHDKHKQQ